LTHPPHNDRHAPPTGSHSAAAEYEQHLASVDHIILGRKTFETAVSFPEWPYPDHEVLVLSRAVTISDPRVTVVRSIDAALAKLDEAGAKGVYVDGGNVIQQFLIRGLIDEIAITRAPVLLGRGISLFGDIGSGIKLTLLGLSSLIMEWSCLDTRSTIFELIPCCVDATCYRCSAARSLHFGREVSFLSCDAGFCVDGLEGGTTSSIWIPLDLYKSRSFLFT
jgi:dihydrofolate reductase